MPKPYKELLYNMRLIITIPLSQGSYPYEPSYHKWPLIDLWLVNLIIKVLKKAKLDKQQKILLSLRFILRHTVLKYIIVVVCTPEQPTT